MSNLTTLNDVLSEADLRVPSFPKPYLSYEVKNFAQSNISLGIYESKLKRPSSVSSAFHAKFISARNLTKPDSQKNVIEITFDVSEGDVKYEPGDAFGFFPKNKSSEVLELLSRISIVHNKDKVFTFSSSSPSKSVPSHLPENVTLEQIFQYFIEIRSVPKKVFIRALAEYTSHEDEKHRLLELCSRQGAKDYQNFVQGANLCLMDLLMAFPSSNPPLEVILEHLPCIVPRFYSVSSSPLHNPNVIKIAFSVIEFPKSECRHSARLGVCTGYFKDNTERYISSMDASALVPKMENLSLDEWKVPAYLRNNTGFKLPNDTTSPLIMIGPGTGVAPFISFMSHRAIQKQGTEILGDYLLFFGCRNKDKDFIYEHELVNFEKDSVLKKLFLSFSRDAGGTRYVQDNIKLMRKDFVNYIADPNVKVYICGDAKNMMKNVFDCIVSIVEEAYCFSNKEAENFVKRMQAEKKYLQDIWV